MRDYWEQWRDRDGSVGRAGVRTIAIYVRSTVAGGVAGRRVEVGTVYAGKQRSAGEQEAGGTTVLYALSCRLCHV